MKAIITLKDGKIESFETDYIEINDTDIVLISQCADYPYGTVAKLEVIMGDSE